MNANRLLLQFLSAAFLLLCALRGALPISAQQQPATYALRGTLILPEGIVDNGIVLIKDGVIAASGDHVAIPASVDIIDTHGGVISPGFIDLHNHLTWNVFPRWKPDQEFGNRYDWQQKAIYQTTVESPHAALASDGFECEMQRYAEVKALTEGETSLIGSLRNACSRGLARNLDLPQELPATSLPAVEYDVFPFQISESDLARIHKQLADKTIPALLIHVAEGAPGDASASREFAMLKARDLLLPGVSLIHAGGLNAANFEEMAAHHVGLVWSPRSNIELYGDTANVVAARKSGVTIAIAPDWSITGSDGTLGELNYAAMWNAIHGSPFTARDLVDMATGNAAALVGQSAALGSLAPGHLADLIVVTPDTSNTVTRHDAYWNLVHASPAQVALVLVGGQPLYGNSELIRQIAHRPGESICVCSSAKAILLTGPSGHADASDETWARTSTILEAALQHTGRKLAALSECGQ
jgi:cytosine/adenosine deaminase-related metal-dependent hydrolase